VANNAKTEFLRRISHDIRTPINGVQGYITMGAEHPDDLVLQKYCRDNATAALHTLMELVNSILDMSKLETEEIILEEKPFDLSELLDEVNAIFRPQAEAQRLRYELIRKERLPVSCLIGSPRHISQILMNLASNAIKFNKPEGYVRLDTHMISSDESEVTYEFVCEDNGIGMSEEFQQHLFEPFMQEAQNARTVYQGSGLGLSIVKKLVDAMGGTITFQSEKNVGTRFSVRMTFQIDQERHHLKEEPKILDESILEGKHVLLVEDNELNMEIAEFFLTEHGANVITAWSGKEALDIFTESKEGYFDLIITDIMMPVMDGLEEVRAIRALNRSDAKTIPISAMSANAFEDDIKKSLNAGMNAHIAKPIDANKLLSVVSELLGEDFK